jgi:hypothetical protein
MGYNMKRGNSAVPFKELGSSPAKQKELPEGVDGQKKILGSEAGSSGFERETKTETGSGSPTDDMSRTHTYDHKYDKDGKLLKGYPKWVEKK